MQTLDEASRTACRLIHQLRHYGRLHRADLARLNAMTRAAMTQSVQSLLSLGVIQEHEATLAPGEMGRPRQWLSLTGRGVISLGLAIEENITLTVLDATHQVLARRRMENHLRDVSCSDHLWESYLNALQEMAKPYVDQGWLVAGLGVSFSGHYDYESQCFAVIHWATADQANQLADEVHRRLGVPVWFEHDTNAELLAESWLQSPRDPQANMMLVTFRLGIGYMLEGRLFRGPVDWGRWLGDYQLWPNGQTNDWKPAGLLERTANIRVATDKLAGYEYGTRPLNHSPMQSQREIDRVVELYAQGDPQMCSILNRGFHDLGLALRTLWRCFPVQTIILSSWPEPMQRDVLNTVHALFQQWPIHPDERRPQARPQIRLGSLKPGDQQAVGAAMAALSQSLQDRIGNHELAIRRRKNRRRPVAGM